MNSSRSHAVFCLKIVSLEEDANNKTSYTASINQLSFCDLAGLERSKQTEATGKTAKEASNINQSLLALSRCMNTMISNQKATTKEQIPYRTNKLTRLFQAYFENRGMVKMIVNFNPSLSCFDESIGVLKFSSIANQIQMNLVEDKKIKYNINTKKQPEDNRLTVGWGTDAENNEDEDLDGSSDCESDESDEEETDESSEEESGEEVSDSGEEVSECGKEEDESGEEVEGETECESGEEESESGEEATEEESGSDEDETDESDDDDSSEQETDDDDDDDDDDDEDDSDAENQTLEGTISKSVIQKSLHFDKSVNKKSNMSKLLKSAAKRTPGLDKSKQFKANESLANRRKSIIETEMTRDQLVMKIESLKAENEQIKNEKIKIEADVRKELTNKWKVRDQQTEEFFQEQLKSNKKSIEDTYIKRMSMLEKTLVRKYEEKLEAQRLEKENEMEKLRGQLLNYNLEIHRFAEEKEKMLKKINELEFKTKRQFNSTEIMSSTTLVKEERMSQSQFDASLKLDETEMTECEEEEEEETETQTETQLEQTGATEYEETETETQLEQTAATECEDEEMESESESGDEESEEEEEGEEESDEESVDQTVNETVNSCANQTFNKSVRKSIKKVILVDAEIQTIEIITNSVECEVNMTCDEGIEIKKQLDIKTNECQLLNEKLRDNEIIINENLKKIENHDQELQDKEKSKLFKSNK